MITTIIIISLSNNLVNLRAKPFKHSLDTRHVNNFPKREIAIKIIWLRGQKIQE